MTYHDILLKQRLQLRTLSKSTFQTTLERTLSAMLANMRITSTLRTPRSLSLPFRHKSKHFSTSHTAPNRRAPTFPIVASLPALLPLVAKAATAGILFYASMNWVFYRGTRKDAEKTVEKQEETEAPKREARKKLIEKLTSGRGSDDDNTKPNNKDL